MPKVMLYEPGESGHRPVILRYLQDELPKLGWTVLVNRDPRYMNLDARDLIALDDCARAGGCDLMHIMTIDGAARSWLRPNSLLRKRTMPIAGTYYLFSNLWGARGLAWLWAIKCGYIDRILISDLYLNERSLVCGLRRHIGFIPDPWSRSEFLSVEREAARGRLGLPREAIIVLVFGDISLRKGVHRILAALRISRAANLIVLFAGKVSADAKKHLDEFMSDPTVSAKILVHDKYIAEHAVSLYFHAADAVLSDYPKSFMVSSGAFTRTLAAGRQAIVPRHGVNYRIARECGMGVYYKSECSISLGRAFDSLADSPIANSELATIEVSSRTTDVFARAVSNSYLRLIGQYRLAVVEKDL